MIRERFITSKPLVFTTIFLDDVLFVIKENVEVETCEGEAVCDEDIPGVLNHNIENVVNV